MASDEDYMAFLNKANADTTAGASAQTSSKKSAFKTMDEGSEAPKVLAGVCQTEVYVSDADEPFEPVSLKWNGEGGLPDEVDFAKLINHSDPDSADITIMDTTDWDTQGQYGKVIDAVREATKGNDVRVYKVVRDRTRVEYWIISREEGRIVGRKPWAWRVEGGYHIESDKK